MHIKIGDKISYLGQQWYVAEYETDDDGYIGIIIHHVDIPDFQTRQEEMDYEVPSCFIRLSVNELGLMIAA